MAEDEEKRLVLAAEDEEETSGKYSEAEDSEDDEAWVADWGSVESITRNALDHGADRNKPTSISQAVRMGALRKKSPNGPKGMKIWQTRYFVLYKDVLEYYPSKATFKMQDRGCASRTCGTFCGVDDERDEFVSNQQQVKPLGVIPLQSVTAVTQYQNKRNGRRFDVVVADEDSSQARVFALSAPSKVTSGLIDACGNDAYIIKRLP
eukprot:TRINITY_DN33159_c0_g1_i2.p1 TRINITY_DN33159_c0_g1~~TRINITY_DN33159_c0_g1_i2.p1  ORF type:complete len:207 (+),score=85.40 TRINITY_DN33159_c0_g1_i2:58-678(+)